MCHISFLKDFSKMIGNMATSVDRNLYVGDLSSICTEEDLFREFSAFGPVDEIRIQRCRRNNTSLCYGFVKMVNSRDASEAVNALNGMLLCGRKLKVRFAEYGLNTGAKVEKYPVCFKFDVIDEGKTCDEILLREIFSEFGEVDDVSIRKTFSDRYTGLQKGFGFLKFVDPTISRDLVAEKSLFIKDGIQYSLHFSGDEFQSEKKAALDSQKFIPGANNRQIRTPNSVANSVFRAETRAPPLANFGGLMPLVILAT